MLTRHAHSAAVGSRAGPQRLHFVHIVTFPAVTRSRQVVCQGLFGLGLPEVAVIAGVAALVFGPSKLPELGKSLGKTVKSLQTAATEFNDELKAGMADDAKKTAAAEEPKKTDGV
ncbi:Sec-independent protein translocase protein TATA, chloroplastic [Tetrabaena socialis]|uniref:Sec-independent protein translocase protein TATA, chloroplastic n=1 Tax=Tetrabaena socialis TaxID=47790 RepID=A0A2J7ZWE9_9CHLO|nr:Sec-independent protein translocase protein TATA, chloroplastic [Tetrabaena socialis]|eukprot:PNH04578.1 Sec-independent protein translocase protein TATA, chloroplastic [Tetrabaena socialis]